MKITDIYTAQSIATQYTTEASNRIPALGAGLFPSRKKLGLDLSYIKAHKGLAVSLAPSNFDAKSVLRGREGFKLEKTQMAFFRESMLVSEEDEQQIMMLQESNERAVAAVVANLYDDSNTLISGANVVAERMRMQLLAPTTDGSPRIVISANGVQYSYNYDPDGTYKANNYTALTSTTDKWNDHTNSDPFKDVMTACDAVENATGTRPAYMIINGETMNHLVQNAKIRSAILAQNSTANIYMTKQRVIDAFRDILGIEIKVYTKKYKDESGTAASYYPSGYATLIPSGALGKTWYGTTPEERTLMGNPQASVAIVETGVAVAVTVTNDPVNTKTTVSEIVLPSYERMEETYVIKAY
nr:MAG TPA: Major capsid protein [Caudoviricetes sp.]